MTAQFSSTINWRGESVAVRVSACSDIGSVRQLNEDSFFARAPIFFVADGMGGHSYGDRASQTVVRVFDEDFRTTEPTTPARVLASIDHANTLVRGLVADDGPDALAGTTLSGVALVEVEEIDDASLHWMVFNVGDSRVYGWNGADVVQITVDHSAVQELVSLGVISAEDALVHPDRNVITRAVGSEREVETDLWLILARGHQVFVICSDGLTKELSDTEIASTIREYGEAPCPDHPLAEELVRRAVDSGGRDNVSVVVVDSTVGPAAQQRDRDDDAKERGGLADDTVDVVHDRTQPKSEG